MKPDGRKIFYAVLAAVAACAVIYVRVRLSGAPLDRDEGEFAYAGQLALKGIPPYFMAYNMKFPGIYWIYALVMAVFGQTDWGIRTGFLIINLLNAALVYSAGKRLMDGRSALAAAACFLVITLTNGVYGIFACAENALILFAMAGLRLILLAADSGLKRWYALAGLFFGLSLVVRQHGIFFLAAGLAYTAYAGRAGGIRKIIQNCAVICAAAAAPLAAMIAYIFAAGVSSNFFFWVFTYGMKYVSAVSLASGAWLFAYFGGTIFNYAFSILLFALAGITVSMHDKKTRGTVLILLVFFSFSFAATAVGMYFRGHYFIYVMPAAALFCGAAVYFFENEARKPAVKMIFRAVLVIVLAAPFIKNYWMYFKGTAEDAARMTYFANPFPEMKKIALYVGQNSSPRDTVAVIGSEPQVYFYSGRSSASAYIYMYPMMEKHDYAGGMQEQGISQMERAKPKFLVLVNVVFSWTMGPQSDTYILKWFDKYIMGRYKIDGTVDMVSPVETRYRWGKEVTDRDYKKSYRITVFKRID